MDLNFTPEEPRSGKRSAPGWRENLPREISHKVHNACT